MDRYYQTVKPPVNTNWCFTYRYLVDDNTRMDIVQIRRQRLRQLINSEYGGSQAAFVDRTGINQGELSALLRNKSFGEKKARALEVAAGLRPMYLDNAGSPEEVADTADKKSQEVPQLTREQRQMLMFMESLDKEARDILLSMGRILVKLASKSEKEDPETYGDPDYYRSKFEETSQPEQARREKEQ